MRQALPVGSLLFTVFTSILEVFLLCLAGYILAAKGILDKKTQKQLNRLNVSLFTPALLFSKVAFFLTPEKLKELYVVPIFFVVVTAVSMAVSFALGTIFRLKKSQRAFAMAASMFMNSNSLPVALMQSLVITMRNDLRWTDDDNKNTMLGRALTYLVLYSTLGMILRWSYGVRLLSQADEQEGLIRLPDDDEGRNVPFIASPQEERNIDFYANTPASSSQSSATTAAFEVPEIIIGHARPLPTRKDSKFYNSFPNSPNQSRVALPDIESAANSRVNSDDELSGDEPSDNEESGLPRPVYRRSGLSHGSTSSTSATLLRHTGRRIKRAWLAFNEFMTVPLWAALLSIIVALVPTLQHTLDVHMSPVKGALTSAGNCSIPVTLVVLGAYFYPNSKVEEANTVTGGSSASATFMQRIKQTLKKGDNQPSPGVGETKTVVVAVLSRMIITPLLLLPLIFLAAKTDFEEVIKDPVFIISNILLVASPPALTLAQITQAASGDAFERLISRTIFWSYCIVTPPIMIVYTVVGLIFSRV